MHALSSAAPISRQRRSPVLPCLACGLGIRRQVFAARRRSGEDGGMSDFSIMSFNLRYPARDGHPVAERLPIAAELIRAAHPHIIGTQHGELDRLGALIDMRPEPFIWLGEGHSGGNSGEFTAVIVASERFDVEAVDISWLSEQPETVASESWGVSHARTLTTVDVRDLATGRRLPLLNPHPDHHAERPRPEPGRNVAVSIAAVD